MKKVLKVVTQVCLLKAFGCRSSNWASFWDRKFSTFLKYWMQNTCIILVKLNLFPVLGNIFVIAAIILERNLQSVANYLILSLAVADLLVAVLVMPLGAVYQVRILVTFDVFLCKRGLKRKHLFYFGRFIFCCDGDKYFKNEYFEKR